MAPERDISADEQNLDTESAKVFNRIRMRFKPNANEGVIYDSGCGAVRSYCYSYEEVALTLTLTLTNHRNPNPNPKARTDPDAKIIDEEI